ncbi:MAG TPA: biotin transporter BioY [Thermoanaerobaculia bacterium]|nr:biotin transporter BioY [Thermoanaerobaculia bacterium]
MQSTKVTTLPAVVIERFVRGRVAADMLLVVGASALIALAAQVAIPIPFSPVPLTLQPLAVIFLGAVLGSTRGAAAAALYLMEGFSGLPVFAQGHGGAIWLMAATAGYLYSYPFAAWLAGFVSERGWGNSTVRAVAGMLAALGVIYLGGWSWLAMLTNARGAFALGVAPFVLSDVIKVAVGAAMLPYAHKIVSRV